MSHEDRHPSVHQVMEFFAFDHLNGPLREVSAEAHGLAEKMLELLPDDPELVVGLRKLLEAKDAFVRAKVRALRA